MDKKEQKIYCSLDIETSGFDPEVAEVLEVGFAFFVIEAREGNAKESTSEANINAKGTSRIKIVEEYTQVFKPTREVPQNILALTGITLKELEQAPSFSKHRDYIQSKLKNSTIVGHNVAFDIKFLQSLGLEFKGEVIDTLDIIQFILPTHHSYNLENLMHTFKVEHKDAHRALADSKAAISLLEKMLGVYQNFPERLKNDIQSLLKKQYFPWAELLEAKIHPQALEQAKEVGVVKESHYPDFKLKDKVIYNFPLGKSCVEDLSALLNAQQSKVLLVLPRLSQAVSLWKAGLAQALFPPELQFNEKKFERALEKKNLTLDQVKFLLKVLVWRATNWQRDSILDLNLSFFGGQFKELIAGGKLQELARPKIVATDFSTFALLSNLGLYKNRFLVVMGLNEFEQAASNGLGNKVSWGFINFHLKSFYNPETGLGDQKFLQPVTELLKATDLFFGLAHALLQQDGQNFQYYKVTSDALYSEEFVRLQQAAVNYAAKIEQLNKEIESREFEDSRQNLLAFFEQQDNRVRWIELATNRCVFCSSPLDISSVIEKFLSPFAKVAFADSLGSERLLKYFSVRLGLKGYKPQDLIKDSNSSFLTQGDLFQTIKAILPESLRQDSHKLKCHCRTEVLPAKDLFRILKGKALPAALLFGSSTQVREFYEQNYETMKEQAHILAQSAAGGGSRMFRNFYIRKDSLLLATDKFVLKHIAGGTGLDRVEQLKVKTLILCHLPFEQFTHPYQEALSSKFAEPFEEFSLPRAVYNFHCLLKFFHTPILENIYICDSKLGKNYAKAFLEYVEKLPHLEMVK